MKISSNLIRRASTLAVLVSLVWYAGLSRVQAQEIFVANGSEGTIRYYSTTGADLGVFASAGLNFPYGIAFDAVGNLYVGNAYRGAIRRFSPLGVDLGDFITFGNGFSYLVFDSSGNVYTSLATSIRKFSPTGQDLGTFAEGLTSPDSLTFDSNGNLYVSDSVDGTIKRFAPGGAFLGIFASGLDSPRSIAFDDRGYLYVANLNGGDVRLFGPDGTAYGSFVAGLDDPEGMAFDDCGNLYVSEYHSGRIQHYLPDGTSLGLFAPGNGSAVGLAFVRRTFDSGWPTSFNVFRGVKEMGRLGCLFDSDDMYLLIRNGVTALRSEAPITISLDGHSAVQTASSFKFQVEMHVTISGLNETVDLFDWIAGTYDTVDAITAQATTADSVVEVVGTNCNRYIQSGTHSVRARLRIRPSGPVLTNTWRAFIDHCLWTIS